MTYDQGPFGAPGSRPGGQQSQPYHGRPQPQPYYERPQEPYYGGPQQPYYGQPQQPYYGQPQQPYHYGGPQQPYYGGPGFPGNPGPYGPVPDGPAAPWVVLVRWAVVAVAVLTVIAALLPWASLTVFGTTYTVHGTDSGKDGWVTLVAAAIAGIVAAVSAAMRNPSPMHLVSGIVAVVLGLGILGVAVVDTVDISSNGSEFVDVGIGLILTLVCGIAMTALGVVGIVKRR